MELAIEQELAIGSLDFDLRSGDLKSGDEVRRLEPRAAAVLAVLAGARGEIMPRQTLLDRCWGEGEGSDEALTQAVAQIRRILEALGESGARIETLAKRGYRIHGVEAVSRASANAPPVARRRPRWLFLAGLLAATLAAVYLFGPHSLRHAIRHGLGLQPAAHSAPQAEGQPHRH